ncbi:MAG: hypothetical protein LBC45_00560 [Chlamydiales bacterium]|jgi:hypothetical protein|nr:hypothetical protein [Chlamydiales bacterium]
MYKISLFLCSFLFSLSCFCITTGQPSCFFTPPPNWDFADPKIWAPRVKVAFISKTKQKTLAPSVILAVEETKADLPKYLQAVQAIYEKKRKTRWCNVDLAKAGLAHLSNSAHLLQIDMKTQYGSVRKLQLIFIKENKAYILTTTALKKEFSNYLEAFQKTLSSFTYTCDLYTPLSKELKTDLEQLETALFEKWKALLVKKTGFEEMFNQTEFQELYWLPLQKKVLEDCQTLGAYWQMIVLRSIREQIRANYLK